MLDALGREHEIESIAAELIDEAEGVGDDGLAADPLARGLDEVRAEITSRDDSPALRERLAEVPEAAADVERVFAADHLVREKLVDERLDAAPRIVVGERSLEAITEPVVGVFSLIGHAA